MTNACNLNPCGLGVAICLDGANSFSCTCNPGYGVGSNSPACVDCKVNQQWNGATDNSPCQDHSECAINRKFTYSSSTDTGTCTDCPNGHTTPSSGFHTTCDSPSTVCSGTFVTYPLSVLSVSERGIPINVSLEINTGHTLKCHEELTVSCRSNNTAEVVLQEIERNPSVEDVTNGMVSKYRLVVAGVMDYTNLDGAQHAEISCDTNYGTNQTFVIQNEDVLFPFFDFETIENTEERSNFLFASRTFRIKASEQMLGPTFFERNNATRVYVAEKRIQDISIDSNGRGLSFIAPVDDVCTPPTKLECRAQLRVENSFRSSPSAVHTPPADVDCVNYGVSDKCNKNGAQIYCSDCDCDFWNNCPSTATTVPSPAPILMDEKRAHYVKKACHSLVVCKEVVDDYRDYPSSSCPAGHEGHCVSCPLGARCPGGNAIWPLPGFSTVTTTQETKIMPCAIPANRCPGYDDSIGEEKCAPGYGGLLCGGCLPSHYYPPVGPRSCHKCPPNANVLDAIFVPVVVTLSILFLVFVVVSSLTFVILKRYDKSATLKMGAKRTVEFMIYVVVSLALLSQVSRASLGKLPEYMNEFARVLAIFQMDISGPISPQCMEQPFFRETALFCMSLLCITILTITFPKRLRLKYCRWNEKNEQCVANLRHGIVFWLCVSYPLVTNFTVKMVHCIPAYSVRGNTTSLVLATNSLVLCGGEEHDLVLKFAIAAGLLHVLLFPILSCAVIIYVRRKYASRWFSPSRTSQREFEKEIPFDQRPMWKYFLANTYLPEWFFIRQMELSVVFVATFCNEVLAETNILAYLVVYLLLAVVCSLTYMRSKPFVQAERWKLPTRLYYFLCIIVYAVTNYLSSRLAMKDKELWDALVPILCTVTMFMCIVLFVVLIISYVVSLINGAKGRKRKRKKKRTSEMTFSINPLARKSDDLEKSLPFEEDDAIQALQEQIPVVVRWYQHLDQSSGDFYYSKEHSTDSVWTQPTGPNIEIIWYTPTDDGNSPESTPEVVRSPKKKEKATKKRKQARKEPPAAAAAAGKLDQARNKLKRGVRAAPPTGTKVVGKWWQLNDTNGTTCYLNTETNEVFYSQPKGWVKMIAKERFGFDSSGGGGGGGEESSAMRTRGSSSV